MADKTYKIAGEEFTLKDLSLGEMEKVQGFIPSEQITFPLAWVNVIRLNCSRLFPIILAPEKDADWYRQGLKANNPVIDEVIADFFVSQSPLQYALRKVEKIK